MAVQNWYFCGCIYMFFTSVPPRVAILSPQTVLQPPELGKGRVHTACIWEQVFCKLERVCVCWGESGGKGALLYQGCHVMISRIIIFDCSVLDWNIFTFCVCDELEIFNTESGTRRVSVVSTLWSMYFRLCVSDDPGWLLYRTWTLKMQ